MGNKKTTILLIDDDEDYYILIKGYLSEFNDCEFILEWAGTYEKGLEGIAQKRHDVYLLDYQLGAKNGIELLKEAIDQGCTAPIIVLTGQGDRSVDMEAMKSGAADYLNKSEIDPYALERAIRYALARKG